MIRNASRHRQLLIARAARSDVARGAFALAVDHRLRHPHPKDGMTAIPARAVSLAERSPSMSITNPRTSPSLHE
jgi:hypothetical protein